MNSSDLLLHITIFYAKYRFFLLSIDILIILDRDRIEGEGAEGLVTE